MTKIIQISSKSGEKPTFRQQQQQAKQHAKQHDKWYTTVYCYYYYIIFYKMSKNNNILVYCQGCGKSFNWNKNQQGKITSGNLTWHLLCPLGMLYRELYKVSGLIQESIRKGGRNKYKLELFTTKNTSLLENSKNQFKNLDRVSLNKRE